MTHAPTTLCACRGTLKNIKNHRTSADDRFRVCIYRILISMYSSVLNEHNNIGADSALTRRAQPILYIMILYAHYMVSFIPKYNQALTPPIFLK